MLGHGPGWRRGVVSLLALGAFLLSVAACGEPSYRYVSNKQLGNYFKVPRGWNAIDLTDSEAADRPEELKTGAVSDLWVVKLVGTPPPPDPKTGAAETSAPILAFHTPSGVAQVTSLDGATRQAMSLERLRITLSPVAGVDPLAAPPDAGIEVVNVVGLSALDPDVIGMRVVMNHAVGKEGDQVVWETRDQSIVFDDVKGLVYIIDIRCSAECYKRESAKIEDIVNSWTVKP